VSQRLRPTFLIVPPFFGTRLPHLQHLLGYLFCIGFSLVSWFWVGLLGLLPHQDALYLRLVRHENVAEPGKLHVRMLIECKVDRPLDPLRVPYGPLELLPRHGGSGFLMAVAHVEKGHAGFWCDVHSFSFVMVC